MKSLFFFLFVCVGGAYAQDCQKILNNARNEVKKSNYQLAIDKYTTAINCDKNLQETVNKELSELFKKIENDRIRAKKAEKTAKEAQKTTEKALAETEKQKAKNQKLVDAFYFAYDKFALAFKGKKFYFIDKNGEKVEKLGQWDRAEQFNEYLYKGFAKVSKVAFDYSPAQVKNEAGDYYLDTLGNFFRVVFSPEDLEYTTKILDLSNYYQTIDLAKISKYSQLEAIFLLDQNTMQDSLHLLANFKQLKKLVLGRCSLQSLPQEIGILQNLEYLDLRLNDFSKEEQAKIRQLLPTCSIEF